MNLCKYIYTKRVYGTHTHTALIISVESVWHRSMGEAGTLYWRSDSLCSVKAIWESKWHIRHTVMTTWPPEAACPFTQIDNKCNFQKQMIGIFQKLTLLWIVRGKKEKFKSTTKIWGLVRIVFMFTKTAFIGLKKQMQ